MSNASGNQIEVLAFAPHPDDAEIFCGGFLLKMAELGYRTAVCDLTRGEMSSQGDPETRMKEAQAASSLLSLSWRGNLEIPDGTIGTLQSGESFLSADSQIAKAALVIRQLKPEIILVPYWQDRHPDHMRASNLVSEAIFYAGLRKFQSESSGPHTPSQVLYYQLRFEFTPSFVCDVTSVHERKIEAICCYESQIRRTPAAAASPTLLSSPLTLEVVDAKDRFYGAMIGVRYGEPLLCKNTLAIDDPVKYFRDRLGHRPLVYPGY